MPGMVEGLRGVRVGDTAALQVTFPVRIGISLSRCLNLFSHSYNVVNYYFSLIILGGLVPVILYIDTANPIF